MNQNIIKRSSRPIYVVLLKRKRHINYYKHRYSERECYSFQSLFSSLYSLPATTSSHPPSAAYSLPTYSLQKRTSRLTPSLRHLMLYHKTVLYSILVEGCSRPYYLWHWSYNNRLSVYTSVGCLRLAETDILTHIRWLPFVQPNYNYVCIAD